VHGVSLEILEGEFHALMGPNGSGKSSLVHALAGHPAYEVTEGKASFLGEALLELDPAERARRGFFLAFQYPREIAGVSLGSFLYAAYKEQWEARHAGEKRFTRIQFQKHLRAQMEELGMDLSLAERSVNVGFSGGEKKKAEVLQLKVLNPLLALLDETDSGLDIDALKVVSDGIKALRSPHFSCLLVTHYARILQYLIPDYVHVMVGGKIVESGGGELAHRLEEGGYGAYGMEGE